MRGPFRLRLGDRRLRRYHGYLTHPKEPAMTAVADRIARTIATEIDARAEQVALGGSPDHLR